jgi:hypothetical protein
MAHQHRVHFGGVAILGLHMFRLAIAGVFLLAAAPAFATPVTLKAVAQPGGAVLTDPVEWQITRLDKKGAPTGSPVAVGSSPTLQTDLKPGRYLLVAKRGTTAVQQGLIVGSSAELRNIVVAPANAADNASARAAKPAVAIAGTPATGTVKPAASAAKPTTTLAATTLAVGPSARLTIGMIPNSGRSFISEPIQWQVFTYVRGATENGQLVADKTIATANFTLPAGTYVVRATYKGTQADLVIPLAGGQSYQYTINLYAGQAKLGAVKPSGPTSEPVQWQIVREKPGADGKYQLVTASSEASPQLLVREGKYLVIGRIGDLWGVEPLSVVAGRITTAKVKLRQRTEVAPVVVASAF